MYDKDRSSGEAEETGKWDLLKTIVGDVLQNGEKILIFTQYVTMLQLLETFIAKVGARDHETIVTKTFKNIYLFQRLPTT